ncbi:hypothetical protein MMC30_005910 [Trapelia coarctata]|nr:hypothetical protein [Trapelia coarctata]
MPSREPQPHPHNTLSTSTTMSAPPLFILTFDQWPPETGCDVRKTILGVFSSFEKAQEGVKTQMRRLNFGPLPGRRYELMHSFPAVDNAFGYELWRNGEGDRVVFSISQCVLDMMEEI